MSMSPSDFRESWSRLGPRGRISLAIGLAGLLLSLVIGAFVLSRPSWTTLAAGLDESAKAGAIEELGRAGIRARAGEGSIEVGVDDLGRARIALADAGLGVSTVASVSSAGGTSREAELARTIESLLGVRSARVHVVSQDDRAQGERARASIIVAIEPGARFSREQARTAARVVADATPGLAAEDVTVSDVSGRALYAGEIGDEPSGTVDLVRWREAAEREVNAKVARVLVPLVGAGNFEVQSTVELVMERVVRRETSFDPDSGVLIVHDREKEGADGARARGRSQINEKWEYDRVERTIEEPRGAPKRLSVAVVVDAESRRDAQAADLSEIEDAIRASIGFDAARGDVVTVTERAFAPVEATDLPSSIDPIAWLPVARIVGFALLLAMLVATLARPVARALGAVSRAKAEPPADPLALPAPERVVALRKSISDLAVAEPHVVASTLRVWMHAPPESP